MTRRSTLTTTVLSILSETTTPCRTRFGIETYSLRRGAGAAALANQCADRGDLATHLAHPRRILQLARGPLEPQIELLFLEFEQPVGQLVRGLSLELGELCHDQASPPRRCTKRVLIGSL